MTDILRRQQAPICAEAWAEIDEQATRILKGNLSMRSIADVEGPKGWTSSSVATGGMTVGKTAPVKGVNWCIREVLPLVEIRIPFALKIWDLDNVARGSKTPDLDAVVKAAQSGAIFEERAVYLGFEQGSINGLLQASDHTAVTIRGGVKDFAAAVEAAVAAIQASGIGGPYDMVLDSALYKQLEVGDDRGYPLKKRILSILGGQVRWSPAIKGGVVVSVRGGDLELTLGQDFSIGYEGQADGKVDLYLTESFTFRVLEPAAAVALKGAK